MGGGGSPNRCCSSLLINLYLFFDSLILVFQVHSAGLLGGEFGDFVGQLSEDGDVSWLEVVRKLLDFSLSDGSDVPGEDSPGLLSSWGLLDDADIDLGPGTKIFDDTSRDGINHESSSFFDGHVVSVATLEDSDSGE